MSKHTCHGGCNFDSCSKAWQEQVFQLEEALRGAREALGLIDIGERDPISAPEDITVKRLCEAVGYGAVMDSAARQWRKKDPIGAFTSGPCVYMVRDVLSEIDRVMGEKG